MPSSNSRHIRIFVSSTFIDMIEDRDTLMTHTWPALRRFCQERQVELVEMDMRWGITEEQNSRRETLKLCLDEIKACRPFFIGLLGERYGWVPDEDAFTDDLVEEQPWLHNFRERSVTELEILHGVLNDPDMAERAFFYLRDPRYVDTVAPDKKRDYTSEDPEAANKQHRLKTLIRQACATHHIPLRENYPGPDQLASLVLDDLTSAIDARFPKADMPDPLTRDAQNHEAFAETRRRTYISRPEDFDTLDRHAYGDGGPLLVLGEIGSGKSSLIANWLAHWRNDHPRDFIVQHYIGGTADSSDPWRLMRRVISEIKRWTDDADALPISREDIQKEFPIWLAKAKTKASRQGVRFILVLDALNQLDDRDYARVLGWLPTHPFAGRLRLIVSTLPHASAPSGQMEAIRKRQWRELTVKPLTALERREYIVLFLARFGKKLDSDRLRRLADADAAANPLYLKILLDDLRVTGTYDRLDQRLSEYLSAADIPSLLMQVLARYQRDYERDRPGLVGDALGLIHASRRGLSENELLRLLRPSDQPQLPPAIWAPLRAALEDSLVDLSGTLNFAHGFLRAATGLAFVRDKSRCDALRLRLADFFESLPVSLRTCDELPWLLKEMRDLPRLRCCLLDIDRFQAINSRDEEELRRYWIDPLRERDTMGFAYLGSYELWSRNTSFSKPDVARAANELGLFLLTSALHVEAEPLIRRALELNQQTFGEDHADVASNLNNLAELFKATNRLDEAEPVMRRALAISEHAYGGAHPSVATVLNNLAMLLRAANRLYEAEPLMRRALDISERAQGEDHPNVAMALNNLAMLLKAANRLTEAEPLMRRALDISDRAFGEEHPAVSIRLSNLAALLQATGRFAEAEPLMRRALDISEHAYGENHPRVAICLNNLSHLLKATNRFAEAEPLIRRALAVTEAGLGKDHPNVAIALSNLALLLQSTNRLAEAEPLFWRALEINKLSFGEEHPDVARDLNNLAQFLHASNRLREAEPLIRRALEIDERTLGTDHPSVARDLNNYAMLLQATSRLAEAEPLMRRMLDILLRSSRATGHAHPDLRAIVTNYAGLLQAMGLSLDEIRATLCRAAPELFQP